MFDIGARIFMHRFAQFSQNSMNIQHKLLKVGEKITAFLLVCQFPKKI